MRITPSPALLTGISAVILLTACSNQAPDSFVLSRDCWIDAVNEKTGEQVLVAKGPVKIGGWAADSSTGMVPESLTVQLLDKDGKVVAKRSVEKKLERADVAKAYNRPGYLQSGFAVEFSDLSPVPDGYGVSIAMRGAGTSVLCPVKVWIKFQ